MALLFEYARAEKASFFEKASVFCSMFVLLSVKNRFFLVRNITPMLIAAQEACLLN
jgi:hypothetical protein